MTRISMHQHYIGVGVAWDGVLEFISSRVGLVY
jgi:hypothetical protein